jgi:NAD(P)H-hydrate epimerase
MKQITTIPKLAKRKADSHKGDYGKVLVIGGSVGMSGAAALAGKAALRSGAGLVRVSVPCSILPTVAAMEPCYTTIGLAEDDRGRISSKAIDAVLDAIRDNDVVAFGPGTGISDGVRSVLEVLIGQAELKLVIDAGGLNNLAKIYNWHQTKKADIIITPHPGEMKRIWESVFRVAIPQDRIEVASSFAKEINACVVLKGAGTVVADEDRYYINTTGNPGMATGGSGDVLTGIIAALRGQGLNAFDAAVLGVYEHGRAGDAAAKARTQASMIASDIIEFLRL